MSESKEGLFIVRRLYLQGKVSVWRGKQLAENQAVRPGQGPADGFFVSLFIFSGFSTVGSPAWQEY